MSTLSSFEVITLFILFKLNWELSKFNGQEELHGYDWADSPVSGG